MKITSEMAERWRKMGTRQAMVNVRMANNGITCRINQLRCEGFVMRMRADERARGGEG